MTSNTQRWHLIALLLPLFFTSNAKKSEDLGRIKPFLIGLKGTIYNFGFKGSKKWNGTIVDDDSWLSAGRMLMRVRRTGIKRARGAEYIASVIQQSPLPMIVCGDFNEIPVSYAYKTLSQGLSGAFQQSAFGFSTTYNGNIPALKIDNILMSKTIEARNCQILNVDYSDHYPMVADLELNF